MAAFEPALDEAVAAATERLKGSRAQDVAAVAATRKAYRALGKDPARYRPAAEALLRRVEQGKGLFRVNTVVEANNLLSLETGFSIGTYVVAELDPPVVFRRGRAGEASRGSAAACSTSRVCRSSPMPLVPSAARPRTVLAAWSRARRRGS